MTELASPSALQALLKEIDRSASSQDWARAELVVQDALARFPEEFGILDRRAALLARQQGRETEALEAASKMRELYPHDQRGWVLALDVLSRCGRWSECHELAEAALAKFPGSPHAALRLAQSVDAVARRDEVRRLEAWTYAAEIPGGFEAAVLGRSAAQIDFERVDDARATFEEALRRFPGSDLTYSSYLKFLMDEYELDEAIELTRRAMGEAEHLPRTLPATLNLLLTLHRYDGVSDLFGSKAFQNHPDAQALRSRFEASRTAWQAASSRWEESAGRSAEFNVTVDQVRGLTRSNDHLTATEAALRLIREHRGNPMAWQVCFDTFRRAGGHYAALSGYFCLTATRLFPDDVDSHFKLACMLIHPVKTRRAETLLHWVVGRTPNASAAGAVAILLCLLESTGRASEARELLQRVVGGDPSSYPADFIQFCQLRQRSQALLAGAEADKLALPEGLIETFPSVALMTDKLVTLGKRRNFTSGRSVPRVALCLSGQLRGYRSAWPSIKRMIVEPLGADVFVSTWDTLGTSLGAPGLVDRFLPVEFQAALPPMLRRGEVFPDVFPSLFRLLTTDKAVTSEELSSSLGLAVCETEDPAGFNEVLPRLAVPRGGWNACRMVYKIWRADALMRHYAEAQGFEYDIVIRLRPDMQLFNFDLGVVDACLLDNRTIATRPAKASGLDDQMAVGSWDAMHIYAQVWPHIESSGTNEYLPWFRGAASESLIRNHLMAYGLSLHSSAGFSWKLCQRQLEWQDFMDAALDDARTAGPNRTSILQGLQFYASSLQAKREAVCQDDLRRYTGMINQQLDAEGVR
ncbi:tetratricopeptide repeat protein [Roseomonas elaeocarpi]|uniref:Tetratricopeptide repeat protein n=1 Tax=Roseomonas elaeocarpi TaxID=907779 RepID=A0ABV6JT85_9PROT